MKLRKAKAGASPGQCPRCGASRPAGCGECPACGQPLCPECGAAVGEHWPSCMACGAQFELFCPECEAPVKPRDRVCPHCGIPLDGEPEERPAPPVQEAAASSPAPPALESAPACSVCGRQDETLRLVAFPFVFSLVIVTYRRAFSGLWCRRHRTRYWFLSSLITATAGWFGIPFGFFYTPLTLYKLARGGEQPADRNQHLLQVLAGHKLRTGDAEGAIRCLEEALRLRDDEAGRRRVQELYAERGPAGVQQARPAARSAARPPAWPLFAAILGAVLLGLTIGLLSSGATAAFSALFAEEGNLLVVVLSWVPWLALLFLGGLALSQVVGWALQRGACRQIALGVALATVLALVVLYGTQQGEVLGIILQDTLAGTALEMPAPGILGPLSVLALGGGIFFVERVSGGTGSAVIHLVIAVVAIGYYLAVSVQAARDAVRWNQALAAVRAGGQPPRVPVLQRGWLAIAAVFMCAIVSVGALPLYSILSLGAAGERLGQITDLYQQGEEDQALAQLEALAEGQPDLPMLRTVLAMAYINRGKFDNAAEALQRAASGQPDVGLNHALLAEVYYLTDRADLSAEELRQAQTLGADEATAQSTLGDVYYLMRDFGQAEACYLKAAELDPEDWTAHLRLASTYATQARFDQALAACDRALELAGDPARVQVAHGYVHIRQEDLDGAAAAFGEAAQSAPDDSTVHAALSYLHYLQGDVAASLREAEEAVRLDPYDETGQEQLALACQAGGDLDRALAAAQEAVRLSPKDDTAHYALGLCYRDRQEREKAVHEFETFLALYYDRAYIRDWKADAEAYLAAVP
jgi:Flp pilus assembly protein TadD